MLMMHSDFRILEGRHKRFFVCLRRVLKKYFLFLVLRNYFKKRLRYYKKNRRSCDTIRQRKHSKEKISIKKWL
jgi:hypothetical protein